MNEQLTLIPVIKHIPQWLADYFYKANAGKYAYKQIFYNSIKPIVLEKYADFVGYDLQIIEQKCLSCDGTGEFKHYHYEEGKRYLLRKEPCFKCNNGIYYTKKITLRRYILNAEVYHIPAISNRVTNIIRNEIKGIIKHEEVSYNDAMRAFIILLWKYNKPAFYNHVKMLVEIEAKSKIRWINELVQSLFKKDNTSDELPF